jgi:BASS family bile acid:Na+ symporter
MRRALTIEVGMQNCGVGTSLAMSVLSAGTVATIPTALYTFGCVLTGTLLAQWFARLGGGGVETGDRDDQATGEAPPDCPA